LKLPAGPVGRNLSPAPTVLRPEPAHIHVEGEAFRAKYWLDPVRLERSGGFRSTDLNRVTALVIEHHDVLLEAWNEYFRESD